MKLADVVSKLDMLEDVAGPVVAYLITEMMLWVIIGVIWLVVFSLYVLVRDFPGFTGVAAILSGVVILVFALVAWRAREADIKVFDDPVA